MILLELMTTDGCHLCEEAIGVLQAVLQPGQADVDLVDIAYDEGLMERYGVRIPVLVEPASGRELGWPFDANDLVQFLAQCQQVSAG